MIISYESYLQKPIVCHPPKYIWKFPLQLKIEFIFPQEIVHIAMKLYFSIKERPAKPQPLQPGLSFAFKLQRRSLADEGNGQRETKGKMHKLRSYLKCPKF